MRQWRYKVNIKPHLGTDTSPAGVKLAKTKVAAELRTIGPFCSGEGALLVGNLLKAFTCSKFNKALEAIYDFADSERIWLGL